MNQMNASNEQCSDEKPARPWSTLEKTTFRLVISYFAIYTFPYVLRLLVITGPLTHLLSDFSHKAVPWVGKHILHITPDITFFKNGSGDTTFAYVQAFCTLVLAFLIFLTWTIVDYKRRSYNKLLQIFRIIIAVDLAETMFSYGFCKLAQFPALSDSQLAEPYGYSSPMGLLWTFMGASRPYCVFAGFAEVLAAVLLMIPRTRTIGALIATAVMTHVFVLNMCYDVPVKLYSFHLLVMAGLLVVPESRRLVDIFILNHRVEPAQVTRIFKKEILNKCIIVAQILYMLFLFCSNLDSAIKDEAKAGAPYVGLWQVRKCEMSSATDDAMATDFIPQNWAKLDISTYGMLTVTLKNGGLSVYLIKSIGNQKIEMDSTGKSTKRLTEWSWARLNQSALTLDGELSGKPVHLELETLPQKWLLMTRGFHWIQEQPFNR
jgi:hypothetical protein